jgi:kinesin family protein 22
MFSRVFDAHSQQTEIFQHTTQPMLKRFVESNENCVIFAYGMTNAGKTHTIQGTNNNPGIFPRLVASILESKIASSSLHVSALEIYQENIYDLLGKRREKLSIRDGYGKVEVNKLSFHSINSTQDAFKLMDTAASKRSKSSTFLNTGSSRSHAVYTLTLTRPSSNGEMNTVAFQLVDLAGAERGARTKATSTQQKEANNINTSLMQLWRCLQAVKRKVKCYLFSFPCFLLIFRFFFSLFSEW